MALLLVYACIQFQMALTGSLCRREVVVTSSSHGTLRQLPMASSLTTLYYRLVMSLLPHPQTSCSTGCLLCCPLQRTPSLSLLAILLGVWRAKRYSQGHWRMVSTLVCGYMYVHCMAYCIGFIAYLQQVGIEYNRLLGRLTHTLSLSSP